MSDSQLNTFWKWFAENSTQLHSDSFDLLVLSELDAIISSLGFGWEIGPGLIKESSLTISPNGDKQLLEQSSKMVDNAPALPNWEFYPSKQPKENWDKANLKGITVDAAKWTYFLLRYPDGKNEIVIQADNLLEIDISVKETAVDLILTNLLGEKRKIEALDFIEIVDNQENENPVTQLKFLPAHLDKINAGLRV